MKRILLPMIALAGLLVAQTPSDDAVARPRQQRAGEALKAALGLDDNQVQQLRDLRQSAAEERKTIAEQMRTQQQALKALREAGNPDPTQVGVIVNEVDRLRAQVRANQEQAHEQAVSMINGWGLGNRLEQLQNAAGLIPAIAPARGLGLMGRSKALGTGLGVRTAPETRDVSAEAAPAPAWDRVRPQLSSEAVASSSRPGEGQQRHRFPAFVFCVCDSRQEEARRWDAGLHSEGLATSWDSPPGML